MSSIICDCGKVLEMRVKLVGLSPAVTFFDEHGLELKCCPRCSREVKGLQEKVIGIRSLIQRWGPGSRRSKI